MFSRIALLAVTLAAGAVYVSHATQPEQVQLQRPLATLPLQIGEWQGRDSPRFTAAVLQVLGADDYVNRVYSASGVPPVGLYVGYYESQRQGDAIHSPMNCMPGAGWEPLEHSLATIHARSATGATRAIVVNEYVMRKGADRQLVFYWYQSHGRVVANEYMSRVFMVYDAVRQKRTDAALVRVMTQIEEFGAESRRDAAARGSAFVQSVFPALSALLPS